MDFAAFKEEAVRSIFEKERSKEPRLDKDPALWEKATLSVEELNHRLTTQIQAGYLSLLRLYNEAKEEKKSLPFLEPGFFSKKKISDEETKKLSCYELTMASCFEIDEDSLIGAYHLAMKLFEQEQYEEASKALFFLNFIHPACSEFLSALGHAEYKLERFQESASFFILAFSASGDDPDDLRYAAFCFNKLGDRDSAMQCLNLAREQMTQV